MFLYHVHIVSLLSSETFYGYHDFNCLYAKKLISEQFLTFINGRFLI